MSADLNTMPAGTTTTSTPAPQSTGRGRKPGQKAKVRQPTPAELLVFESVEAEERNTVRRQRGERDENQRKYDALVQMVRGEWRELGSPGKWEQMPVKSLKTPKSGIEDMQFFLGKAAKYHNARMIYGKVTNKDKNGKTFADGFWRIPFCVVDPKTETSGVPEQ